jgi:hypothetical protein
MHILKQWSSTVWGGGVVEGRGWGVGGGGEWTE